MIPSVRVSRNFPFYDHMPPARSAQSAASAGFADVSGAWSELNSRFLLSAARAVNLEAFDITTACPRGLPRCLLSLVYLGLVTTLTKPSRSPPSLQSLTIPS